MKKLFTVSLYLCLCLGFLFVSKVKAEFRVVGYLANWENFVTDANEVDYDKVTHINIAFINPNNIGVLRPTTNLSTVVGIVHAHNRKVLASIGGATVQLNTWNTIFSSQANRTAFVNTLMQFVATYNLDGIDVDIEGNLLDGTIITSAQYESFIIELGTALHGQNKLMTSALATWFGHQVTNTAARQFDWINVMAYDAKGTWTGPGQHSSYNFAVTDLNYWLTKVVDKDHLVLGLPSYGYGWGSSDDPTNYSIDYSDIVDTYPRAINQDSITVSANEVIYYNGIPTIKSKTSLALTKSGGVMMWMLQKDYLTSNPYSLLRAMHEVIQASSGNTPPTVSLVQPTNGSSYAEGDDISVSATADDSDGSITGVSFSVIKGGVTYELGSKTAAPYSVDWKGSGPGTYKVFARASDNAFTTAYSDTITVTITTPSTHTPIGNWTIPGKIEAENFDAGLNLGYQDSDAANQGGAYRTTTVDIETCSDLQGGYNVGYTGPGEWLKYTVNVAATGNYTFTARVASNQANNSFHLEVDGVNVTNTINVPMTNGWQVWQTLTYNNLPLTQGQHVLKFVFDSGTFNLNYINFASASVTSVHGAEASGSVTATASPNPFTSSAKLNFSLKEGGQTKVVLNNVIGAAPVVLTDQYYAPGDYSVEISGHNLPAGIYLCTITCGERSKVVKLIKQ